MIDTIRWEVTYQNGTQLLESRGARYELIDRTNVRSFLLRDHEGPIVELVADGGRNGHNLFYRRRTVILDGETKMLFVVGWIPQGPFLAVDPGDHQVYQSATLVHGDPVFYPPLPFSFERFTVLTPSRIINPAHERID